MPVCGCECVRAHHCPTYLFSLFIEKHTFILFLALTLSRTHFTLLYSFLFMYTLYIGGTHGKCMNASIFIFCCFLGISLYFFFSSLLLAAAAAAIVDGRADSIVHLFAGIFVFV